MVWRHCHKEIRAVAHRHAESKYTGKETDDVQGDEQFEIDDNRSLDKMYKDIAEEGLQPVLNDYLYV